MFCCVTHVTLFYYIFYCVLFCHSVNLFLSFNKKGPGGYLIRVDLIRFPGSIPGAIQMCTDDTHQLYLIIVTRGKCTNYKLVLDAYSCN